MKVKIFSITIAIMLICSYVLADDIDLPHITVYGTALSEVEPDNMRWSLQVKNEGLKLKEVALNHTKMIENVLSFLKESEISTDKLQTSNMEFGENWVYKNSSRIKVGYFSSTDISFESTNFDIYKNLWLGLATFQGVSINDVQYDHTKKIELKNDIRKRAVLDAKKKATVLAEALNAQLGEPLLIEEEQKPSYQTMFYASYDASVAPSEVEKDTGLAPGKISIRARIKVAFKLISKD